MPEFNWYYAVGVVLGAFITKLYEWQRLKGDSPWEWQYVKGAALATLAALAGGEIGLAVMSSGDPNGLNTLLTGFAFGAAAARIGRVEQKAYEEGQ